MNIIVTENAFRRIEQLIKERSNKNSILRISVDPGGCAGFSYKYEFVDDYDKEDHIIKKDNIIVVIDPISKTYLNDCKVDFIEELGNAYFQIQNPNSTSKCGCGNSFSVD